MFAHRLYCWCRCFSCFCCSKTHFNNSVYCARALRSFTDCVRWKTLDGWKKKRLVVDIRFVVRVCLYVCVDVCVFHWVGYAVRYVFNDVMCLWSAAFACFLCFFATRYLCYLLLLLLLLLLLYVLCTHNFILPYIPHINSNTLNGLLVAACGWENGLCFVHDKQN